MSLAPSKMLSYNAKTGKNNLDDYLPDAEMAAKSIIGVYASILRKVEIPAEWSQAQPALSVAQIDALSAEELQERKAAKALVDGWNAVKVRFIPHLLNTISTSSMDRINSKYRDRFRDACLNDDIIDVLKVIRASHTFIDKTSTLQDRAKILCSLLTFTNNGEDLPSYLKRWNITVRLGERLGIKEPPGNLQFYYAQGLLQKCHEDIRDMVVSEVDRLNRLTEEERNVAENFNATEWTDKLISRLSAAGGGKAPASVVPMALAAGATIASKIKKSAEANAGKAETTSEKILQSKMKSGMTRTEAKADLVCRNCNKAGHIAKDCRSAKSNDADATKSKGKPGSKKKKNKNATTLAAEMDADLEDDDFGQTHVFSATGYWAVGNLAQLDEDADADTDDAMPMLTSAVDSDWDEDLDKHSDDDEVMFAFVSAQERVSHYSSDDEVPDLVGASDSESDSECDDYEVAYVCADAATDVAPLAATQERDSKTDLSDSVPELVDASDSDSDSDSDDDEAHTSGADVSSEERHAMEDFVSGQRSLIAFPISLTIDETSEGPDPESKDYVYDDSLSNVPIFSNVELLSNVRKLREPIVVGGVGGAVVTLCGTHPFLGNVLVLPTLKFNIVPQHYWRSRFGYTLSFRHGGTELVASKDGCPDIVFQEHSSTGNCFKRVHNDMLRSTVSGPVRRAAIVSTAASARPIAMPTAVPVHTPARFYTAEQRQRAAEALALHQLLRHPSDAVLIAYIRSPSVTNCTLTEADVRAMRDIYGPCSTCATGKPLPVKGTNSMRESLNVTRPGGLLHCDIVFVRNRTYLIAVDEVTRYVYLVQLESKHTADVMSGFKIVIEALRASHHVVQYVHTDHEAVFDACRSPLGDMGTTLKLRIPGEHEPVAERSVRIIREKIRMQLLQIQESGLPHPRILDPYLIQACVFARNSVPNSHTMPLVPSEIVHGERINYLTDNVADYFDLILVAIPSGSKNPSGAKHEVSLCLGTVGRRTPGAVYALSRESKRVTQRRPLRVMPMTPDWRRHIVEMAISGGQSVFEDFFIQETGTVANDLAELPEQLEERDIVAAIDEAVRETSAPSTAAEDAAAELVPASDVVRVNDVVVPAMNASPTTTSTPPLPKTRYIRSNAPTVVQPPAVAQSPAVATPPAVVHPPVPVTPPPVVSTVHDVASSPDEGLRRSTRVKRPNSMLKGTTGEVSMCADLDQCLRVAFAVLGDDDELTMLTDAEHWNQPTAMVVSLESAMKTVNAAAAVAAAKKEIKSLIDHRTWRYLHSIKDRQPSTHTGVEPSACIVKDKKDSRGQFLLYKARLFDVGSHTNDNNYGAFDKTSPTADHNTICLMVALASYWGLMVETFDVPSAYVKASLPEGKRHCMRVNKTVAALVVEVDPEAKRYLQPDGTLLVELLQALYGLPEAGNLWHAFLCAIFRKAGYVQMPGDSCVWKRVHNINGEKGISLCAIIVDDVLHMFNKIGMRDHLYDVLKREKVPSVTVQTLTEKTPVSFCGLSLEKTGKDVLFMSQPGFLEALIADMSESDTVYPTPLPSNYATRKLTEKQLEPMSGGTRKYLRTLNSVAWLERTRPDLCAAVSYLQTEQANPRVVDWTDLQHVLGYLRGAGNLGISYDVKSMQPFLSVDVGWAVHVRDRKSHTGWTATVGRDGPAVGWGSSKQKGVAPSSTDGELVGLSDKADNLLVIESKLNFFGVKVSRPMTILQDNTSTITMSYMGRPSAHARRRYIDIRYFWLKQYLDNKTFELVYCASELMLADPLASIRGGQEFARFVRRLLTVGPLRVYDQRK
jgi:hypothetical protein